MAKSVERQCPACGTVKPFRADQKTCGCQSTQVPTSEVTEYLRAKNAQQGAEIHRLREQVGGQKELGTLVAAALKAADPFPAPRKADTARGGSPVVAVHVRSDWHIGEKIDADEVENFNQYDYATAERRIFYIQEAELKWATKQRNAYDISEAVVVGLADWVSGDIHRELSVTNEFPVPVQAAKAGLLLGEYLRRLAPHFERVSVYEIGADNHGRLNPKPQAKQKGANSFSYIVHAIANVYCSGIKNIVTTEAQGAKLLIDIAGWKFLAEHGDNIRAYMGIPFYGMNRAVGREAKRRMMTDLGFHKVIMGHWHVPSLIEDTIIVNGSLSGTSEYDHQAGRHAEPSQVSFLIHPRWGMFNFTAFKAPR